jgi:hypothetical protein
MADVDAARNECAVAESRKAARRLVRRGPPWPCSKLLSAVVRAGTALDGSWPGHSSRLELGSGATDQPDGRSASFSSDALRGRGPAVVVVRAAFAVVDEASSSNGRVVDVVDVVVESDL